MMQRTTMISRQLQAARAASGVLAATRSVCSGPAQASRTHRFTQMPLRRIEVPSCKGTRRFFSSAKSDGGEQKSSESEEEKAADQQKEESVEEKLEKELGKKDRDIIDLKDKYLRSVAEFQNLQQRAQRDIDAAKQFGIQRFAVDLIDSIDNFDRALNAVPSNKLADVEANKELIELYSGLKMTEKVLFAALRKHGLERFDPCEKVEGKAQKFDPKSHEATFMAPSKDMQNGEVMYTQTKGFRLNGRVVRAAKVGVVRNS